MWDVPLQDARRTRTARRQQRLRAASMLVMASAAGQVPEIPRSFASASSNVRGRSQPSSDVSSHLLEPKWHRLAGAVAQVLVSNSDDPEAASPKVSSVFVHPDAVGGGTEVDIKLCLTALLEALDLSDRDTGFILLHAYHYWQIENMPITSQTWRPLLVVGVLFGIRAVLESPAEVDGAQNRLHRHVAHWWPKQCSDRALERFAARDVFGDQRLGPAALASLYFDLRDRALRMCEGPDGSESGSFLSTDFSGVAPVPLAVARPGKLRSLEGSPRSAEGQGGESCESSLHWSRASSSCDSAGDDTGGHRAAGQRRHFVSL